MRNARPYINGQTIQYYVLMALENGKHQCCHIQTFLNREHAERLEIKQISRALQSLRKEGLARYNGRWERFQWEP